MERNRKTMGRKEAPIFPLLAHYESEALVSACRSPSVWGFYLLP